MRAILFILGVIICLLASIRIATPDVSSFDRFKVRTTEQNLKLGHNEFVATAKSDHTAVAAALANIHAGNAVYTSSANLDDVFQLIQTSRALVGINILDILKEGSPANKEHLDAHLRYLQIVIEKSTQTIASLQEYVNVRMSEATTCLQKKQAGDQIFFQGVDAKQGSDASVGLAQSLQYAPCYISKRIEANAYGYIASQLTATLSVLKQRYALLTANRDTLITYSGLFDGDLLSQLQVLKQQMVTINTPQSSSSTSNIFNFFLFDKNTVLPTYNHVWYDTNNIPNYQDPGVTLHAP